MASTTLYCSRADLTARLTDGGIEFLVDDNGDRVVGEAEKVDSLDRAITVAGALIDQSLCPWIESTLSPVTVEAVRDSANLAGRCKPK